MAAQAIRTVRGQYSVRIAGEVQRSDRGAMLTVQAERRDEIERFAFRCRIAPALLEPARDDDAIASKIARWLETNFETTREAALKTIRSERRMLEVWFDDTNRGPF